MAPSHRLRARRRAARRRQAGASAPLPSPFPPRPTPPPPGRAAPRRARSRSTPRTSRSSASARGASACAACSGSRSRPERASSTSSPRARPSPSPISPAPLADDPALDPRPLHRAAHRVVARWPEGALGRPLDSAAVEASLAAEGLPAGDVETARISRAVAGFLDGDYLREALEQGATLARDEPFVASVKLAGRTPRRLLVRGTWDVRVDWPDGIDVLVITMGHAPGASGGARSGAPHRSARRGGGLPRGQRPGRGARPGRGRRAPLAARRGPGRSARPRGSRALRGRAGGAGRAGGGGAPRGSPGGYPAVAMRAAGVRVRGGLPRGWRGRRVSWW